MLKKSFWCLAALAGLMVFVTLFDYAFPTASIDLRLDRHQARVQAKEYLADLGYDVSGYQTSVVFSGDTSKFVFLEKCLGLFQANTLVRDTIHIWYWDVRFFKELTKEGFSVKVNPIGSVSGFSHDLEELAFGESLAQEDAETLVTAFLEAQKIDIARYEKIQSSSARKEHRTDHHFCWKLSESAVTWTDGETEADGMVRVSVDVHGDQIGGFRTYFWTPEVFNRSLRKVQSEGHFLALISSFFYMMFYVAAIVMFILSFRNGGMPFRMMLTIAILVAGPHCLYVLNSIPLLKAGYDTQVTYLVYYGSQLVSALKGIINQVIVILIVFCAGSFVSRTVFPRQVEGLHSLINREPILKVTRGEIYGGYVFACIVLGFVTGFYFLGMRYCGVWVFPSTRYSNILGTLFPFLLPLSMSIVAAVSEEFIFRMFAVSFLKKYVKVTFLAVLIPSLIWAFAHSSYAVFPIYTRGIELTIVALAFCFVFLRYGIVACIVAHYVIDAVLFSIPLLRSSNAYFLLSGIIVVLLALVPAMVGLKIKKV